MTSLQAYAAFCAGPDAPVFHQPWWLDAVGLPWDAAVALNGQDVAGVWPYTLERKAGLTIVRNPPLTPYLGPTVAFPHNLKDGKRDAFEYQTIARLAEQLPAAAAWAGTLTPGLKQAGLLRASGFDLTVRQTFLLSLQGIDAATLLQQMHEDHRRNLRKAEDEFEITDDPTCISELYAFHQAVLQRKGSNVHHTETQFRRLAEASHSRGQAAVWAARSGGTLHALVWNVWDSARSYYLVGVQNPAAGNKRAVTALIWHAIRHAQGLGKTIFDFEGSMDPGVEAFYRAFGARRELYLVLQKERSLLWRLYRKLRG